MALTHPQVLSFEQLGSFLPFKTLNCVERILLARRARVEDVMRGTELAPLFEEEGDEIFLLEGKLTLISRDGALREVSASTASAMGAISALRPRQYRVVANSRCKILFVPLDIMNWAMSRSQSVMSVAELELDMTDDADSLFAQVLTDLTSFNVRLPVTRQGAASIRVLANEPNVSLSMLGQAALIEPSVAVKLIAAANHSLSAPIRPLQNTFAAAAHLGVEATRSLLQAFTSPDFIPDRYSATFAQFVEAVRQSREVAYMCAQLAELSGSLVAANAYLIGLLHAIGEIAALAYAESNKELALDQRRLSRCIAEVKPSLSATILREYGFNSDAVIGASSASDWLREVSDHLDYGDLVILAQLHAAIGTARARLVPPMHSIPAFTRIANGQLSPARSLAMIRLARTMAEQTKLPEWQVKVG